MFLHRGTAPKTDENPRFMMISTVQPLFRQQPSLTSNLQAKMRLRLNAFSGAGAAAMACANLFISVGVRPENLILCDSRGVIYEGRTERMNPYKERLAVKTIYALSVKHWWGRIFVVRWRVL